MTAGVKCMEITSVLSIHEHSATTRTAVIAGADIAFRHRLTAALTTLRWKVREAGGGAEAMALVESEPPEVLLLDRWLPDLEAGEFAQQMCQLYPEMDVLSTDGNGDRIASHAKSPRRHELLHALREAQQITTDFTTSRHPAQTSNVVTGLSPAHLGIPEMVGGSAPMLELARMIRLVAPRSTTVLIEGETGTGKEVVAQALHRLGSRSTKPFVTLNCAAIPESLLEAELFGHTRGAFTGAVQSRMGRIEAAHGGTLFLDEIGEMPLALQAKMLRFLECGELQRVGENQTTRVDVRVIAATHQPLEQRAEERAFRLDLYHRLAVFPLHVPTLRERIEDLPRLVEFFLDRLATQMPRKQIAPAALETLSTYRWPGNVRELMHVLERGAILAEDRFEIGPAEIRLRQRDSNGLTERRNT